MSQASTLRPGIGRPAGLLVLLAAILAALGAAAPAAAGPDGADTSTAPWIASDAPDYAPGGRVTLEGGNWQPGEAVRIEVEDDQDRSWQRDVTVTADGAGRILDTFDLPAWFVATYSVKATGSSGARATAAFTDSNPQAIIVAAPISATVVQGSSGAYGTLTLEAGGNTNPCNTTFAAVAGGGTGLPAGATLQWTTNPVTTTGSNVTTSFTIHTAASTAPGTYTFRIAGTNTTPPGGQCQGGGPTQSILLTLVVTPGSVSTTVAASSASATYGAASVTLNATVTPASGPAVGGGTVTFTVKKGAATIGSVTSGAVASGAASASFPLAGVDADAYAIEASYSGAAGFDAGANGGQSPAPTLTVAQRSVSGSFTAAGKVYDGTTAATITGRSLTGAIDGDDVALAGGAASFADRHAGTGKTVTGTGFGLAGAKAANYELASSTLTASADITPLGITGSFTAADRVYDGTAAATITGRSLTGAIDGDDVALDGGTASFADKHAGEDKPVSGTGFSLAGTDRDDYTLGSVAGTTASIDRRDLALAAHGVDKVYDGTTAAGVTFTDDRIAGDVLAASATASFADKHVGDDKPVAVTGIALAGADAGNYRLAGTTASTEADITPRALTVAATGVNKVYDGTTVAAVTLSDDRVDGDDLATSYAAASFADANAGTGKTVTVTGISVTGPDAGNYTYDATASTTADIDRRPLTVTADAKSKPFGAPDPALTYAVSGGPLVAGDGVSGSLSRQPGEAVGSYDILLGSVSAGPNYAIAYVGAALTIGSWHATGFYQPIGAQNSQFVPAPGAAPAVANAVWNSAKSGSTIPLRFNLYTALGGQERTSTADVKEFQATKLAACTGGDGEEAVEFVTTGNTSLRYDGTAGQFVQNWKTPSVTKDECYRVSVRFADGSAIYAFVKLRK